MILSALLTTFDENTEQRSLFQAKAFKFAANLFWATWKIILLHLNGWIKIRLRTATLCCDGGTSKKSENWNFPHLLKIEISTWSCFVVCSGGKLLYNFFSHLKLNWHWLSLLLKKYWNFFALSSSKFLRCFKTKFIKKHFLG